MPYEDIPKAEELLKQTHKQHSVEMREKLTSLLAKTDGNDALAKKLQEILGEMGKKEAEIAGEGNVTDAGVMPRVAYQVENKLSPDGGKIGVELRFNHLDDFSPADSEPHEGWLHKAYEVLEALHILGESAEKAEQLHEGVVSPTARQERETLELETHKSRENISEFGKPVIDKYRQAIDQLNGDEQAPRESEEQSVQPQKKKLKQFPK